ncbi:hypothetical protein DFS34DRAFT_646508 [Phlyctochytrium arcticum]|nr:hypothetical protein DFS34DRAFT_646508 [Phlyctochytrium arcticum]
MPESAHDEEVQAAHIIPPPSVPPPEDATGLTLPLILLDHQKALSPSTKPEFLYWLRMALLYHGSFYLTNVGIPEEVTEEMAKMAEALFKLPQAEKESCSVINSPGFLGWGGISEGECRETWEFGPDIDKRADGQNPVQKFRYAQNQYPSEQVLPGGKEIIKAYNKFLTDLSFTYNELILEALGLPTGAFDAFWDEDSKTGGKIKFNRYFRADDPKLFGEAPYRDAWLSFTMFANDVPGVEMRSESNQTLLLPPLPSTLLVQSGIALSFATHHAILSLPHRVLQPPEDMNDTLLIRFATLLRPDLSYDEILQGAHGLEQMCEEAQRVGKDRSAKGRRGFNIVRKVVGGLRGFKHAAEAAISPSKDHAATPSTVGIAELQRRIKSNPVAASRHFPDIAVSS